MKKGQYVFWSYGHFPYALGGTVEHVSTAKKGEYLHGMVRTVEYGAGYNFTPRHIMPAEKGKEIRRKLEELRESLRLEQDKLNREYMSRALAIAPWLKNFPAYENLSAVPSWEWRVRPTMNETPCCLDPSKPQGIGCNC